MDYLLMKEELDLIQKKLEEIGELSLLVIKKQEMLSKDDTWEKAVEINKLGRELYLKVSRLPRN